MNHHTNGIRYSKWLFLGPAIIHLVWAYGVLHSPTKLKTTGLFDLYHWFGDDRLTTGCVLATIGVMAAASVFVHRRSPMLSLLMLAPQQWAMILTALTAWRCIRDGTFADGAVYNSDFILVDQCYCFVVGIAHTGLIIDVYAWDGFKLWIMARSR